MASREFHKLLCGQWNDFKDKPAPGMRRAIMLSEKGSAPCFKWLPVPRGSDERAAEELRAYGNASQVNEGFDNNLAVPEYDSEEAEDFTDYNAAFGPAAGARSYRAVVCGKLGSGKLLDHSIHLCYDDNCAMEPPNGCLGKHVGAEAATI